MGLAESGYYTIKNRQGSDVAKTSKCLATGAGNDVAALTCDRANPKTVWYYDQKDGTVCNKKNCLVTKSDIGEGHKVMAYVKDEPVPDFMKWLWTHDLAQGGNAGTICNKATGYCLENGLPSSKGQMVAAYNDADKSPNKRWLADPAQCVKAESYPSAATLVGTNHQNICSGICKTKGGDYGGVYVGGLNKSKCTCNMWSTSNCAA